MKKHSFVILLDYMEYFEGEVLQPLKLTILPDESDLDLGYYTVQGSEKSISELKKFLNGEYVL